MASENTAIWRATAAQGATEGAALAINKIVFNPSPVLASAGYIFDTEVFYRNAVPENPKVAGDINEVQDMGLDGIDIQITGQLRPSSTNTDVQNLVNWLREDKVDQVNFPKGIFGLRMDDLPQFNVTPKDDPNGYGYVLASCRFLRQGEFKEKLGIVLTLRFSGDITGLGT